MKNTIHKYFTTGILDLFEIPEKDKKAILRSDLAQDKLLGSVNHYGERARDIFLDTYSNYSGGPTNEDLGKLFHYLLDISTPIHIERSFKPFALLYHYFYETQGKEFLTEDTMNIAIERGLENYHEDYDVIMGVNELYRARELALEEFAELGGEEQDFITIPTSKRGILEFVVRCALYKLFHRKKDEDWLEDKFDLAGTRKEIEVMISEVEKMDKKVQDLTLNEIILILKSIKSPEANDEVKLNIKFIFFWAIALLKHYLDCVERSVPIAIALCENKYSKL